MLKHRSKQTERRSRRSPIRFETYSRWTYGKYPSGCRISRAECYSRLRLILIVPSAVAALCHDRFFDLSYYILIEVHHEKNRYKYSYRRSLTHTSLFSRVMRLKRKNRSLRSTEHLRAERCNSRRARQERSISPRLTRLTASQRKTIPTSPTCSTP